MFTTVLALICLPVTTAHAIPVVVESVYTAGNGNTVATEAFFDTASLTGTGTEQVQLSAFDLQFSFRSITQSADIVFPVLLPFPEKTLVAEFVDGVFDHFFSVDRGGNNRILIRPSLVFGGEGISLGRNELIHFPCCANFTRYRLTSRVGPTPLSGPAPTPEPTTVALLALGLLVASRASVARRRTA